MTSGGIMMAVKDALNQAEITSAAIVSEDSNQEEYKDGTYTGVGQGKNPGLIVSVTIYNDKISNIEFETDNEPKGKEAFGIITKEIIDAQSTSVYSVSGATMTSNAIIMAVNDALNQSKINN